jgi:hypothetical protein
MEHSMQFVTRFVSLAGLTALILTGPSTAWAQTVTFSGISDAVPGRFFDAATTVPDEDDPNTLIIGLNSGFDFRTWKYNDFRASTLAFSHASAMDTISFTVEAPEGYYIASITYTQRGSGYVIRTGKVAGMTNWVVGDYATDLGLFGTNPTLSGKMDLTGVRMARVAVSISNSLFGFSTPALGAANLAVTSANVRVELLPLEVEPTPVEEPAPVEGEPAPEEVKPPPGS